MCGDESIIDHLVSPPILEITFISGIRSLALITPVILLHQGIGNAMSSCGNIWVASACGDEFIVNLVSLPILVKVVSLEIRDLSLHGRIESTVLRSAEFRIQPRRSINCARGVTSGSRVSNLTVLNGCRTSVRQDIVWMLQRLASVLQLPREREVRHHYLMQPGGSSSSSDGNDEDAMIRGRTTPSITE